MDSEIKLVDRKDIPRIKSTRKRGYNRAYTPDEERFVRMNWESMNDAELAGELGRTISSIKAYRQREGLVDSNRFWTEEESAIVKKYYPDTDNDKILAMLPGKNLTGLYNVAFKIGVHKSDAFLAKQLKAAGKKLASSGLGHRFKKGHVPGNKGLKQEEYMSPEAIERSKKTRFKKGNVPANAKFDGAISLRKDSNGNNYLWIRIGVGEWQEYHRYMYEKHIGVIPAEHIVVMKDGNSLNCNPDNLEAITRQEHVQRNRNWEKSLQTMDERQVGPKYFTDNTIAAWLSYGDKELRKHILANEPELIRVARANYKLKRVIRDGHNDN